MKKYCYCLEYIFDKYGKNEQRSFVTDSVTEFIEEAQRLSKDDTYYDNLKAYAGEVSEIPLCDVINPFVKNTSKKK